MQFYTLGPFSVQNRFWLQRWRQTHTEGKQKRTIKMPAISKYRSSKKKKIIPATHKTLGCNFYFMFLPLENPCCSLPPSRCLSCGNLALCPPPLTTRELEHGSLQGRHRSSRACVASAEATEA